MKRNVRSRSLRLLCRTALLCALLCVLSVLTLPIGAVPVTLSMLGVFLCGLLLPPAQAVLAVLGYLMLGALGLPVFSAMQGGIGVLGGLTGGFLWGYLPAVLVLSVFCRPMPPSRRTVPGLVGACAVSLLLCYACGTVQFMLISHSTLPRALAVCVLPFLLPDIFKIAAAVGIRTRFGNRL